MHLPCWTQSFFVQVLFIHKRYTTDVKQNSLVCGKCTKHCDSPPKRDNYTWYHNVHIWSCLTQSCVHARGEISDTPSDTSAIPIFSSSSLRPQIDSFLLSFPLPYSSLISLSSLFLFLFLYFLFPFFFPFPFPFLSSSFPGLFLFPSSSFPLPFLSFPLFYKTMGSVWAAPKAIPFFGKLSEDTEFDIGDKISQVCMLKKSKKSQSSSSWL